MRTEIQNVISEYNKIHFRRRKRVWIISAVGLIVAAATALCLMLPAITMSTVCGFETHQHEPECWSKTEIPGTREIVCGVGESEALVVHSHDFYCYGADGELICGLPELALHTHCDGCRDEAGELICGRDEVVLHTHTDACEKDGCDLPEVTAHQHTAECVRET